MTKFYRDYFWKGGIPYGLGNGQNTLQDMSEGYKIVSDPYHKRISVEKYSQGHLTEIIYDSAFLDFRHLKPNTQYAWHKEVIKESDTEAVAVIRNQDDRVVAIETYTFENGLCRSCQAHTPHGIPISTQKLYYTALGDPFNGVGLFDRNNKPVMQKKYGVDKEGEFTNVLEETWEFQLK